MALYSKLEWGTKREMERHNKWPYTRSWCEELRERKRNNFTVKQGPRGREKPENSGNLKTFSGSLNIREFCKKSLKVSDFYRWLVYCVAPVVNNLILKAGPDLDVVFVLSSTLQGSRKTSYNKNCNLRDLKVVLICSISDYQSCWKWYSEFEGSAGTPIVARDWLIR